MTFNHDEGSFTLSTGRKLTCGNLLILGISPAEGPMLYPGYGTAYTPGERREIAEYMVALWQQWAA